MKFHNIPIISWDVYDPENPEKNIGHTIKIPNRCMDEMLYSHKCDGPIFIEITPKDNTIKKVPCRCLLFANVEISEEDVIVAPYWSMAKIGLESFDQVSIENVSNVRKAEYIKVRANSSEYVYWEGLKETLEAEFSKINAICVGDLVNVYGIEFYVIELRDADRIGMLDGSLFNTDVKIDFDTPSDIVEAERRVREEQARLEEQRKMIAEKALAEIKLKEDQEELKRNPYFRGEGQSIGEKTQEEISREERAKMFERLFQKKSD